MRKSLALMLLVFLAFGFLACNGETTTGSTTTTTATGTTTVETTTTSTTATTTTTTGMSDQDLVDAAYEWLDLGDLSGLTNSSPRLIMPTSRDGVSISWSISNTTYISTSGVISQPDNETGNQTVTLTATLTLNEVETIKVFTATVIALPPVEETPPLINETFADYDDGDIIPQTTEGIWGPVSNKTGSSHFYVVSTVDDSTIPEGSKALKINAFTELQIEAALVHTYDELVVEADVYQNANGSPIYLQTSSSTPIIGFGLTGGDSDSGSIYYRTDNGDMIETAIPLDTWVRIRLEADLVNKTIEYFFYDETGNLVPCTPGPVTYTGITSFNSIFIRSGSSTTVALNENSSYITNIVANRPEALPRPEEGIKLGLVSGISPEVSLENGTTFTPETPIVKNYYGSQATLVKDTDYSVSVDNPVDVNVDGVYTVTYTITNLTDASDTKQVTSEVTVYSPAEPNVLNSVTSTVAGAVDHLTTLTVSIMRAEGTLHYVISDTVLTGTEIVASPDKVSVTVTATSMTLADLVVQPNEKVYLVVELNGLSNVIEHTVTHQELVSITTAQEFYDALHRSESEQSGVYFVLAADIDFTSFTWTVADNEFVAVFDGQGHTISNLTINKIGLKGGIFGFLENATIKNLVLDNITTTSDQSASGLLASEIRGTTIIENIVIMNSSNVVDNQYGAIIAGRIRSSTNCSVTISNISVSDTYMESTNTYGGGLIGGMDTTTEVVFEDIYLNNFSVYESTSVTATGQMVGAIIGRVQGNTTISRVVGINVSVNGIKNVGGLIGKSDEPGVVVTIEDIYLNGNIVFDPTNDHANILVGNIADHVPTATNVWASGFTTVSVLGLGVDPANIINHTLTNSESWWTTNIPNILTSSLWRFNVDGVVLDNLYQVSLPKYIVTLDYNQGATDEVIYLTEGTIFDHTAPDAPGFVFVDWYSDQAMTLPLGDSFAITADVTIYGKYDVAPASTVSFDTGTEGPAVDSQLVNYGEFATAPVVADTMIGGVLKTLTGWTLDGVPFAFTSAIVDDITLVAVWETVVYTVTFEGMDPILVPYGELATQPTETPTHPAFASILFGQWDLAGVDYDFNLPVTSNLDLEIDWVVPDMLQITTVDQFWFMANHDNNYNYVLMNDLDFAAYTWLPEDADFEGTLDGGGFSVKNLTIDKVGIKGGIFTFVENATISNLILDNVNTNSDQSASGLLAAEFRGTVLIDNVQIINSSAIISNQYGALVAGRIRSTGTAVTITDLAIINSYVESTSTYGGGIIGGMDVGSSLTVTDVFLLDFIVKESTNNTGQMVGAIIGRVQGNTTIERVVGINVDVTGVKNVGGLIGKSDEAGVTVLIKDVYIQGEIHYGDTTSANIIAGNVSDQMPTLVNVYASGFANASTSGLGLDPAYVVDAELIASESWWTTNMPNILLSPLWSYHFLIPVTNHAIPLLDPIHTVTLDYNQGATDAAIYLWDQSVFAYTAPEVMGYAFVGWYTDAAMTVALETGFVVSADVTLYGKYDVIPPSTVSFDLGTSGVVMDSQIVNHGSLATEPVVADTMIGDVLMTVTGWMLDSVAFDFSTPITEDMTLVAVWEVKTYTVSLEGEADQTVAYGELAVEPTVDPTHPMFASITFQYWALSGVQYDFSTPVTSDLSLAIAWVVPASITVTTLDQFHYVATAGTDYNYVLANNLDYTGYNWVDTGNSFKGTFDGANYTISNLTFTVANGYGGIFARANGATISNLVLDNITITATTRVGALIGRIESGSVTVENIVLKNSSISGADSNGTGGLIGQASYETMAFNIAILNTTVYSTNKNVGGLVGRVDQASMIADDIFIDGLTATSISTASSDVGLGGLVGYVTNYASSSFGAIRVVIQNTTLDGNAAGAFAGYLRYPGTGDIMDAYFEVTFVNGERTGLIGYNRDQVVVLDQSTIFGSFTNATTHDQVVDLTNTAIPDSNTWWDTNINPIYLSSLWTVNVDGSVILNIAS
ncbi:MAG: InlB B-repeat-containing protein [Bacilli bacterium]|nr:InlB B-repeat-containing protein [Bacilli bacterium]